METFYKKLNIINIPSKDKKILEKSIKKNFNANEVNTFNTNYQFFDIDKLDQKKFKSNFEIVKLIKKKKKQKIKKNSFIKCYICGHEKPH